MSELARVRTAAARWTLHRAYDKTGVAVPAARQVMCEECGTYAPPATCEPDSPGQWIAGHVDITGHRHFTETTIQHCIAVQVDGAPGEAQP